jgi:hypothetical protein
MTELITPSGEAFTAYVDGGQVLDNPYPKGTTQHEEWLIEFALLLEQTNTRLTRENEALLECMG